MCEKKTTESEGMGEEAQKKKNSSKGEYHIEGGWDNLKPATLFLGQMKGRIKITSLMIGQWPSEGFGSNLAISSLFATTR